MPWASNSRTLIIKHLAMEVSQFNYSLVGARQADVELYGGQVAIDVVEGYLTTLETLDASLQANAEDAAIQVLGIGSGIQYFPGGVRGGVQSEMARLKCQIAKMLNLSADSLGDLSTGQCSWNGGRVIRG